MKNEISNGICYALNEKISQFNFSSFQNIFHLVELRRSQLELMVSNFK